MTFAEAQRENESANGGFFAAMDVAESRFQQKARQKVYFDHPEVFAREVLRDENNPDGIYLWSKQVEIGTSLVENSYTAVKSCHGAGKSMSAAVFVCWFVTTRLAENNSPDDVFVITTAPTYSQVHLVLWEEIRKFHAMGNLPGYITGSDEWKINHNGRVIELAVGRKPADTDANGFQGKHSYNLMIVLDEANGIPEVLFTGAVSMLTGDMSRQKMLAIGNPDDPNSLFGRENRKDTLRRERNESEFWHWVQIKAWDTPNFTDEKEIVPSKVLESVLQVSWVERAAQQWAKDDARWIAKVEAEFPDQSSDSFFSMNLVMQAQQNEPDPAWKVESNFLGVDLSRYGKDRTVLAHNFHGVITIADTWTKTDSVTAARKIHDKALELQVSQVRVDVGNIGGAVIDMLRTMCGYNYIVVTMDSSASSPDLMRWRNARAFWYDSLKQQMMLNAIQIPKSDDLETELGAIKYKLHDKGGSLLLETKDEIAKRLGGKSTDYADAVVYAAADLTMYVEQNGEQPPQDGEERIVEFGQAVLLAQMTGGFTVSPV